MFQNAFVKNRGKKTCVKGIERSYFNVRQGRACMELQQDLGKK